MRLLLLATFCLLGLIDVNAMGDNNDIIKSKMNMIDFSKQITKEEAIIIAQNYMIGKGCDVGSAKIFGEHDSFLSDKSWHITFNTSLKVRWQTGLKWDTVDVDKKTGQVVGTGSGPS